MRGALQRMLKQDPRIQKIPKQAKTGKHSKKREKHQRILDTSLSSAFTQSENHALKKGRKGGSLSFSRMSASPLCMARKQRNASPTGC